MSNSHATNRKHRRKVYARGTGVKEHKKREKRRKKATWQEHQRTEPAPAHAEASGG